MRLFFAIDLPDDVTAALSGLQRHIKGGRPVPPENMHLTLTFLGEHTDETVVEDMHLAVEAKRFIAPQITISGIGHFGQAEPRVIWVGASPKEPLEMIHTRIAQIARRAGCDMPKRRYLPHVTLARYTKGDPLAAVSLAQLFEKTPGFRSDPFKPTAFHLYRSHLGKSGASYEPLASYPFQTI